MGGFFVLFMLMGVLDFLFVFIFILVVGCITGLMLMFLLGILG